MLDRNQGLSTAQLKCFATSSEILRQLSILANDAQTAQHL
jgi:hypothetical protein